MVELLGLSCPVISNDPCRRNIRGGGGATRPLPRDGGVELHGDPTVGPRPKVWTRGQIYCTNVSPPQRGGAVPAPLSERWAEMARQLFRGARPSGRPQSSGNTLMVGRQVFNSKINIHVQLECTILRVKWYDVIKR